jgi:hypothetical protein
LTEGEHKEEKAEISREPSYHAMEVDDRVEGKDVKGSEGEMNKRSKGKTKAMELVTLEEEGRQGDLLEEFYRLTFAESLPDPAPIPPVTVKIRPVPPPVSKAAQSKVRNPYLVDLQLFTCAIEQKAEWKITPTCNIIICLIYNVERQDKALIIASAANDGIEYVFGTCSRQH